MKDRPFKRAFNNAGIMPSPDYRLQMKIRVLKKRFLAAGDIDGAKKYREHILDFCRRFNLQVPEELVERE